MSDPFDASPSSSQILAAARRHGLVLTESRAELDTSGLDFVAVHAVDERGTPWILRAPRRAEVFAASQIEARVLDLVRSRLPVAVPDWQVHTPELIAYPRLSGTPALTMTSAGPHWNIDAQTPPDAFIESYAAALAALQAIVPELDDGVPTRTIAEVRATLAADMDATREVLRPSDAVWARWQRWLADDELWPQHLALGHGDLHPGHLLLADDGRITGILDWTEACVGDPGIDLALLLGCFGRATLERVLPWFERAGGVVWPRVVDHAAERWAASAVAGAKWALHTRNEAVLEFSRVQLAAVTAETQ